MSPDVIDYRFVQACLLDAVVIVFLVSGTAKLLGLQTFRFGLQLLPFMTFCLLRAGPSEPDELG